jgi:ATP-binding protein involved in chromosome partitioning
VIELHAVEACAKKQLIRLGIGRKSFMSNKLNKESVIEILRTVNDPELNRDLVSLNMIKDVVVEDGNVSLSVVLATPASPLKNHIKNDVKNAIEKLEGVADIKINMSAVVPQDKAIQDKGNKSLKNIIAISSGKGGVGKSTVAVNIAVALSVAGSKVGLMDADIYGPNIPKMMGLSKLPQPKDGKLIPAEAFGVKVISIGFLVKDGQPLIWRGPLLHSTIKQFIEDVDWGALDYLVIDLPPGTGDVQLSLSQHIPVTCGVVVTMPQQVSVDDASRGIEMFQKLGIPIAGVIENMGGLELTDGTVINVFGSGGGEDMANKYGLNFLGRIPLDPDIRIHGDSGKPIVVNNPDTKVSVIFKDIAGKIASYISQLVLKK